MNHQKILVLDFGSQVTQLIARRVRESGVFCEILPCDVESERIKNYGASGIICRAATNPPTKRAPTKHPKLFSI